MGKNYHGNSGNRHGGQSQAPAAPTVAVAAAASDGDSVATEIEGAAEHTGFIPEPGSVVHFYSDEVCRIYDDRGHNGMGAGPYAATVTQVFTDADGAVTYCNLYVIPPFAAPFHEGSVPMKGAENDDGARYWAWPNME